MSSYGLMKATSRAQRSDTILDLMRINGWLHKAGMRGISSYGQSVRALENSIALGIENMNTEGMPILERGESFYRSIIPEIKVTERQRWQKIQSNP